VIAFAGTYVSPSGSSAIASSKKEYDEAPRIQQENAAQSKKSCAKEVE
jgi:hypothetical protein